MARGQKQKIRRSRQKKVGHTNIKELIQQALHYQQTGFLNNAEAIYRDILQSDPQQPDALHFMGMLYLQHGNSDLATEYIDKSIQLNRNNAVYHNNYGLALVSKNNLSKSEQAYRKAIELQPAYFEAWFNLGVVLYAQGDIPASEEAYKQSLKIKPDFIKAMFNLACVQEIQSKQDEAARTIENILKITPDSAEAYNTLAAALHKIGGRENLRKAGKYYTKALEMKPDHLDAYLGMGALLEEGNRIDNAIKCYEQVLELEPEHQSAKVFLAQALIKEGEFSTARDYLSEILNTNPNNVTAYVGLGNIMRQEGNFNGAESQYNKAREINNRAAGAISGLSQCRKYTKEDYQFIENTKNITNVEQSGTLCFALGKLYDDIGDYDNAFQYYKIANDIKNKNIEYEKRINSEYTDNIINTFSDEFVHSFQGSGNESGLPVFIIGTPRSGTTLIEQIIASHPQVFGAGELKYITELANNKSTSGKSKVKYPDRIKTLTPEDIHRESKDYLNKIKSLSNNQNTLRITDKMPANFMLLGYIKILFPNARIIHCKRHPLDSCLSIYFQQFLSRHQYAFDLENIGYWYKDYLRLMAHWQELFGPDIYHVEYDDTVNKLEETARSMIDYCGLEWDDNCLEFHKTRKNVKTASEWQVRQPIYKTSLARWQHYDKHIGVLKEIFAGTY